MTGIAIAASGLMIAVALQDFRLRSAFWVEGDDWQYPTSCIDCGRPLVDSTDSISARRDCQQCRLHFRLPSQHNLH